MSDTYTAVSASGHLAAPSAMPVARAVPRRRRCPRSWSVPKRVPAAAWICGIVATLNAASWSFITPPFQVPDEPDHFAYVKQLAETRSLPASSEERFSPEEKLVLEALNYEQVRQHPGTGTISSQAEQRKLDEVLVGVGQLPKQGAPYAGVATSEPPLYYALESIPYILGSHGTLLDRLQLMRLLSALMAGLTAMFTLLFLREAMPAVRWSSTVGALAVAFVPLFGFMSGAVNPDSMLFAVSAALFYCVARAFRRGLTVRSAIATGVVIAVGLLTKLNFAGLAPGAFLALFVLAARGVRSSGRGALRAPAIAAAIGGLPILAFLIGKALSDHAKIGIASRVVKATHGSVLSAASYVWQLYLPRLPGMVNDFPGLFTTRQIWFDGYVGRFGWLDTFFPGWVYTVALILAGLIAALCVRALLASRVALRGRVTELVVYALMALGLLVLVGVDSYLVFPTQLASYGQARYLLPLLPLLGAGIALAARGAGRRWGPATGALIVVLFIAHDLFGQLQVIARYYG
jgi:4-amino-4-deoxy-L-arabinose transferase-like glycosyltransferase